MDTEGKRSRVRLGSVTENGKNYSMTYVEQMNEAVVK